MTKTSKINFECEGGGVAICARVIRATHLNSEATSIAVIPETKTLIVGKHNGEVVFLPFNLIPSSCYRLATRVESAENEEDPITALCYGHINKVNPLNFEEPPKVISITCNGYLQVIIPPSEDEDKRSLPRVICTQKTYANICAAFMYDCDRDGQMELIVCMTDRVVRTFRFSAEKDMFLPVCKWDFPAQISAMAIGETAIRGPEAWLSQHMTHQYVCVRFIEKNTVESVELLSALTEPVYKMIILPYRCFYLCLIDTCVKDIIIFVNMKERRVHNPGSDIVGISSLRLPCFNMLITVDRIGIVFIYAFNERKIKAERVEPVVRYKCLPDIVKMTTSIREDFLIISTVNIDKKVIVNAIPLKLIRKQLDKDLSKHPEREMKTMELKNKIPI